MTKKNKQSSSVISLSPRGITALPIVAIILVLALVVVGSVYFATRDNSTTAGMANANVTAASWRTYTNTTPPFSIQYPPSWNAHGGGSAFPQALVAFDTSAMIATCGCSVYVTIEDNPQRLAPAAWLDDTSVPKRDSYISRTAYNDRTNSANATTQALAGTYSERSLTVSGFPAIEQLRGAEGGGYKRLLVARDAVVYAVTAWSDANYFSEAAKQGDGGALAGIADQMLASFTPLP